jgi:DNA-binding MarR family transcriptional regulator
MKDLKVDFSDNEKDDLKKLLILINEISEFYGKNLNFKVRELELMLFLHINPKVGYEFCKKELKHNSGSAISRYSINLEKANIVNREIGFKDVVTLSLKKEFNSILTEFFNKNKKDAKQLLKAISSLREIVNENNLGISLFKVILGLALDEVERQRDLMIVCKSPNNSSTSKNISILEKEKYLIKENDTYVLTNKYYHTVCLSFMNYFRNENN